MFKPIKYIPFFAMLAIFLLPNVSHAQTTGDCPESYYNIAGYTCIPIISDYSLTTCAGVDITKEIIIDVMDLLFGVGFTLHEIWVEEMVFPEIVRALGKMAESISMGHMKQAEKMGEYIDSQMFHDAMYKIQKNKIDAINANIPSEETCKMATMTQGLIAATNAGKAEVWSNVNFLKNEAMSGAYSASSEIDGKAHIMSSMCRYFDRSSTVNSFTEVCDGVDPDSNYAGKFLLASYVQDPSIAQNAKEPVNAAMLSMFFNKTVPTFSKNLMEANDTKLAYMDHRSVLSRELLNTYCFQRTFEDKLGGTPMSTYQRQAMIEMGLTNDYITNKLGDNPSSYTQKKLLTDLVMSPKFGLELVDGDENILKLSHIIQSHKMVDLYDSLEILHCNELILSQLLNDRLRPMRDDLQERFDTIVASRSTSSDNKRYASSNVEYNNNFNTEVGGK